MHTFCVFLVSIVVSIPACHAGDRGSIPRRGELFLRVITHHSEFQWDETTPILTLKHIL